ncbi:MAG: hypothetical protein ACKO43_03725 [Alphaproteobacteria bacterium]
MSETIRMLQDRMKVVSKEIQRLVEEKKEIQTALDAIEERKNCEDLEPTVKDHDKLTLSAQILKTLKKFDRPLSVDKILHALKERGVDTTRGSISATLTRLKAKQDVVNEGRKWQLLPLLNDHVNF